MLCSRLCRLLPLFGRSRALERRPELSLAPGCHSSLVGWRFALGSTIPESAASRQELYFVVMAEVNLKIYLID